MTISFHVHLKQCLNIISSKTKAIVNVKLLFNLFSWAFWEGGGGTSESRIQAPEKKIIKVPSLKEKSLTQEGGLVGDYGPFISLSASPVKSRLTFLDWVGNHNIHFTFFQYFHKKQMPDLAKIMLYIHSAKKKVNTFFLSFVQITEPNRCIYPHALARICSFLLNDLCFEQNYYWLPFGLVLVKSLMTASHAVLTNKYYTKTRTNIYSTNNGMEYLSA